MPNRFLQPQAGNEGGQESAQCHKDVGDAQCFQAGFHVKAHAVGVNPEITVIHMAARAGPGSGGQKDQDWIQTKLAAIGADSVAAVTTATVPDPCTIFKTAAITNGIRINGKPVSITIWASFSPAPETFKI